MSAKTSLGWSALILSLVLAPSLLIAESTGASAKQTEPAAARDGVTRRVLDSHPDPQTRKRILSAFERASRLTVFYTPENEMGRLGFNTQMARDSASFTLSARCRGSCGVSFKNLQDELAKGLRIEGNWPGPVGAVIDLKTESEEFVASVIATAEGQCFTLDGRSYFLSNLSLRKRFEALSVAVR